MLKFLSLLFLFFLLAVLGSVLFVETGWITQVIERERAATAAWLGEASAARLAARAGARFDAGVVRPGLIAGSVRLIVPDAEDRRRAGALGDMGSGNIIPYAQIRVFTFWRLVEQAFYRVEHLLLWLFILAPFALAALFDGGLMRRVKQLEFGNASPAGHRYSLYGLLLLLYAAVLGLLAPAVWPPPLAPLLVILLTGCARGVLVHTPPRM